MNEETNKKQDTTERAPVEAGLIKPGTVVKLGLDVHARQITVCRHNERSVLTPPPGPWRDISGAQHSARFKYEKQKDMMICPAWRKLTYSRTRVREGKQLEIHGKRGECEGCEVRSQCTKSKHNRTVELPAKGYEEQVRRRKQWDEKEVKKAYAKRAGIIEPVFAQIKNVMGLRGWTMKGLEKVRMQWQMLCASWNMKVLVRHWRAAKAA